MSLSQKDTSLKPLSSTNFNLPLLYLLVPEIKVTLDNAETHLSEFYDDQEQAHLLLDSIDKFQQLSSVLKLISLNGVSQLSETLSLSIQKLYDEGNSKNEKLILNISEGVMILERYIEFVLLNETVLPTLLLPIINKLNAELNRKKMNAESLRPNDYTSISILNPENHYQPLKDLPLDSQPLIKAYRSGLEVVLVNDTESLTKDELKKLESMHNACHLIAKHSNTLFWQAADAVTLDIASILPLDNAQKRTLIYLEQQFKNHLPTGDSQFANLVSFACTRNNDIADKVKQIVDDNNANGEHDSQMEHYLYGPNACLANTLNELIQNNIDVIKEHVDAFVRGESDNPIEQDTKEISDKIYDLGCILDLINLNEAANALKMSAKEVRQWRSPTPDDFDKLLGSLMISENAAIYLAKSQSPGAIMHPLHNKHISAYQLNTAYETLVVESRVIIANIEQLIDDYIETDYSDISILSDIPLMIHQVSGALHFLNLSDGYTMLQRLFKFMSARLNDSEHSFSQLELSQFADVILSIDYILNGYQNSQPVGNHVLKASVDSLNQLLAA